MKALRYFRLGPAVVIALILFLGLLAAVYGVALVHAAHEYRTMRARFCEHLVASYNARNPRVRTLALVDPCVAWTEISGEVVR